MLPGHHLFFPLPRPFTQPLRPLLVRHRAPFLIHYRRKIIFFSAVAFGSALCSGSPKTRLLKTTNILALLHLVFSFLLFVSEDRHQLNSCGLWGASGLHLYKLSLAFSAFSPLPSTLGASLDSLLYGPSPIRPLIPASTALVIRHLPHSCPTLLPSILASY